MAAKRRRTTGLGEGLPREKLLAQGPDGLSDGELLALVLGTSGRTGMSVFQWAEEVLASVGGLAGLFRVEIEELLAVPGLGPAKACRLRAGLELARRAMRPGLPSGRRLRRPEEVADWFRVTIGLAERESFWVVALDVRNRVIRPVRVAEGHQEGVQVHPREVFRQLVRLGASACVLVHNHPSGDVSPSAEDLALTRRLEEVGRLLGIRVLDHVVVGQSGYESLAALGLCCGETDSGAPEVGCDGGAMEPAWPA